MDDIISLFFILFLLWFLLISVMLLSEKSDLIERLEKMTITGKDEEKINIVLEGQYKEALEDLMLAYEAKIPAALIGPVGTGKTLLARYFAQKLGKRFYWITFTDLVRPHTLVGYFDPIKVLQYGYTLQSFVFGPLLKAVLSGDLFFGNEINRADEYVLNVFLDILEEKTLEIPQLQRRVKVHEDFYFIVAMNPSEYKGTRKLSEAFRSRIGVWIHLDYPPRHIELNIIKANILGGEIPEHLLERIVDMINYIRRDSAVEKPPSIRTGIYIARFAIRRAQKYRRKATIEDIKYAALRVLPEAIELSNPEEKTIEYVKNVLMRIGM